MMSCKEVITDPQTLVNLFKTECCRVFSDKLNQVEDKIWYDKAIAQSAVEAFGDELAAQVLLAAPRVCVGVWGIVRCGACAFVWMCVC